MSTIKDCRKLVVRPKIRGVPYYGTTMCQATYKSGKPCKNKAYWNSGGTFTCGVHKKDGAVKLKKDPNAAASKKQDLAEHQVTVENTRTENQVAGRRGTVTASKLRMMKPVPHKKGYASIFPNFKHTKRTDGIGMSKLSPKSLGPVNHRMPAALLPPAQSIENYHQHAKFWKFELRSNGLPTEDAHSLRIRAYKSKTADRHKHSRQKLKAAVKGGNINVPEYSLFYSSTGEPRKYNYLQSRFFYCHYFEELAQKEAEFATLKKMVEDGYNVNLIGYDSYEPAQTAEGLWKQYNNTSKPFGHELVLCALLILNDPEDYPWNRFRREHPELYADMI